MATCKRCGKGGLEWRQENERWWLYDPQTDRAHMKMDCEDQRLKNMGDEIAQKAVRPVLTRGDRVVHNRGFYGTVEALTKPYTETKLNYRYDWRNREYTNEIAGVKGDVFALVKWDDPQATERLKKWVNTRNLKLADKT